jgi:hypothetical protein
VVLPARGLNARPREPELRRSSPLPRRKHWASDCGPVPLASLHSVFQSCQHPFRPDRRIHPSPSGSDGSGCISCFQHFCRFRRSVRHVSTFLHPFAPCPLRHFLVTTDALTPVRASSSRRVRPSWFPGSFHEQVSLIHALDLRTLLSPNTSVSPTSFSHVTLQPAGLPSRSSVGVWVSPLEGRLTEHYGRIEFVILRTGPSPSVALHTASWRRSFFRFQAGERMPGEDFHPSDHARFQAHLPRLRRWYFVVLPES